MKFIPRLPLLGFAAVFISFFGFSHADASNLGDDHASEDLLKSVIFTEDVFETYPDGSRPEPLTEPLIAPLRSGGPMAPSPSQPQGALSGRIVFTSGGHGWQRNSSGTFWTLDRPLLLEMNEAYGNRDQMSIFADYVFNAGATVVAFRPIGYQTNEVVIDNVDPEVIWSGPWNNSSQTVYYGKPGQLPYRWASLASQETATATYVPTIPEAGFYPVYTWVRHGSDRTFQLYRIRHTGGESQVRIPHHKVGNGWVYLGTYYFAEGSNPESGAVVISNLRPVEAVGSVVIADAIRFGNGMSSEGSTYPREDEASRYWIKNSLGVGQSTTIYDLGSGYTEGQDNVGAPIRMAAEMNREAASPLYDSIYLGFHSNAAGGRGAIGLYNTSANRRTPNQVRWAELVGKETNEHLRSMNPQLEVPWSTRTAYTYGSTFGEINNLSINNEFDATITEVAFHDNAQDAILLRDPKVRYWIARASYRAVMKYMNEFAGVPLRYLPDPPRNARAIAGENGEVTISWDTPVYGTGSGAPSGYLVYRSTDGYGFGQPVRVDGLNNTSITLENLPTGAPIYFRVSSINEGGESFPSESVGAHPGGSSGKSRVLFVNAFERLDRHINIRQSPYDRQYLPPGHDGNSGVIDRVIPRSVNSFDYVVQHGRAIDSAGWVFDSASKEAVGHGKVSLDNYNVVIWAAGQDGVADESFNSAQRTRVAAYLDAGGAIFVSGSEVAYHLDRPNGPSTGERSFLHNSLRAHFSLENVQTHSVVTRTGAIFEGLPAVNFDNGPGGIYPVRNPSRIVPSAEGGSVPALFYNGGLGGPAAIQYDGSDGGGRVVFFAFPFETILDSDQRNNYMARILDFLDKTGYELWKEVHFSQAEINDPEISGESANPAGDGIANILKYALHLDPKESNRDQLPEISVEEDFLTFRFRQSKNATDISFEVEVSDDLVTWHSGEDETELIDTIDEGEYRLIVVRDKKPFPENGRRFMRLQVSRE